MFSYIIRRTLLMLPTLLGMTAVVFFVMALSPGGVGGPQMSAEGQAQMDAKTRQSRREYYNRRYGLDKPVIVQYGRWLNAVSPVGFQRRDDGSVNLGAPTVKWPDLGESFLKSRPVVDLYAEALPITLLLNLITAPLVFVLAVVSGIYAARYRGGWFDTTTGTVFVALWSVPEMWAGVMLIGYLANEQYFRIFPAGGLHDTLADQMQFLPHWAATGFERGYLLDLFWHLGLPILCLTYGGFAMLSKLSRGAVLDNLASEYVRTARAKGVSEKVVLFRHVLRNSLLPLIPSAVGLLPGLLGGSIIIESIFSLQGMGNLTIQAINARDRDLVLAGALVSGVLVLIFDLIRDLAYAVADPRVSYE